MKKTTLDEHTRAIATDGFTIMPGLLTSKECSEARRELEARHPDRGVGGFELLFNKARVFERLYQLPDLLQVVRHFVGQDALLSAVYGSVVQPGEGGRGLHSDAGISGHNREESLADDDRGKRVTSHVLAVNVIFCISEFTATNGATEIVPGSHTYEYLDVPEEAYDRAITAAAPQGAGIVFNVNTWHGQTLNQTTEPRYAVLSPWRRRWTKSEYEMARIVAPDVLERAGDDGPVIFGLPAQPPYIERWQWDFEHGGPKKEFAHLERP